jgi:ATP-dependent Clp protease ATP-binding subunit ClpB
MREHFRPEFLNRIDEIIVFASLGREAIARIVDIQLQRLRSLLADRQVGLDLTPAARALLAREGYDRDYGARPLKRIIQRKVQDPLALKILQGEFPPGDTVVVDAGADGSTLTFARHGAAATNAGAPVA